MCVNGSSRECPYPGPWDQHLFFGGAGGVIMVAGCRSSTERFLKCQSNWYKDSIDPQVSV